MLKQERRLVSFAVVIVLLSNLQVFATQYKVELIKELSIGEPKDFGHITDVVVDDSGYILIADMGLLSIKKYSQEGVLVQTFEAEFGDEDDPILSIYRIDVDSLGNIYATDFVGRKVVVFDKSGKMKKIIKVGMMPHEVIPGEDNTFYTIGFIGSFKGPMIRQYTHNGVLKRAFLERDVMDKFVAFSGNMGRIKKHGDQLVYALPYPPDVFSFTLEGKMIQKFRLKGSFNEPREAINYGRIVNFTPSHCSGIAFLPSGELIYLMSDWESPDKGPFDYYLYLISPAGETLFVSKLSDLSEELENSANITSIECDTEGNLYFSLNKPHFRLIKYDCKITRLEQD